MMNDINQALQGNRSVQSIKATMNVCSVGYSQFIYQASETSHTTVSLHLLPIPISF